MLHCGMSPEREALAHSSTREIRKRKYARRVSHLSAEWLDRECARMRAKYMELPKTTKTCETCGVAVHTTAGNLRWCAECRKVMYPLAQREQRRLREKKLRQNGAAAHA